MKNESNKHKAAGRYFLIALLSAYYLFCAICLYTAFFHTLPVAEELKSYSGAVAGYEKVFRRFSGTSIRFDFDDGTRIVMDESFDLKDAQSIRLGEVLTVRGEGNGLKDDSMHGYEIRRGDEIIHSLESSLERMAKEQVFNRVLSVILLLLPPLIAVIGLAWEKNVLGESGKGKI